MYKSVYLKVPQGGVWTTVIFHKCTAPETSFSRWVNDGFLTTVNWIILLFPDYCQRMNVALLFLCSQRYNFQLSAVQSYHNSEQKKSLWRRAWRTCILSPSISRTSFYLCVKTEPWENWVLRSPCFAPFRTVDIESCCCGPVLRDALSNSCLKCIIIST